MRLQIAVRGAVGRSRQLTAENLVNMYAEQSPDGAKSKVNLVGAPGCVNFGDLIGGLRGIYYVTTLYCVSGQTLYTVDDTGAATALGHIAGNGPVFIHDNGVQVCVVANPKGYVYTVGGGLVEITDADFPGASSLDFLDGYFIFTDPDTGEFFVSALYDGTDIDALDFATAESAPDNLIRCFVDHREIWLFGVNSIEIWYNSGGADFPFSRIEGAVVERGLGAIGSVAKFDNSIVWVDNAGVVRRAGKGYVPERISEHNIEYQISRGTLADITAFTYIQEGHEFYVMIIPEVGTWAYDAATDQWHQRKSYGDDLWRAGYYAYAYNKHIIGDRINGKLYELSLDSYEEAGDPLIAEMTFPPVQLDGDRFRVSSVQLDMEVGVAGTEPQVMLTTSRDGRTWSNESWENFGSTGEYDKVVQWNRLGQYRTCHLKFKISSPVKRAVYSAYMEAIRDA